MAVHCTSLAPFAVPPPPETDATLPLLRFLSWSPTRYQSCSPLVLQVYWTILAPLTVLPPPATDMHLPLLSFTGL